MKDQILKIAKVKSEKDFYKKYPTEEAFMAKHGKTLQKAAMGKAMVNKQLHQLTDWSNPPIAQDGTWLSGVPGLGTSQATYNPSTGMVDSAKGFVTQADTTAATAGAPTKGFDAGGAGMAALGALPKLISGIQAIGEQKKAKQKAKQAGQLSGLALEASQTMEKPKNQYVTPYDNPTQPGQLGNPYGTDTNYLQAQNGTVIRDVTGGNPTEIQNTYAPTGTLYNDLGYEPLNDSNPKQYRHGGDLPKAEFGEYFQDSGEAQVGSAVGGAIGSMFGPAGEAVGSLLGKVGGNLFGGAKSARELQAQKDKTALNQSQMGFEQARSQGPLSASLEDGGWVSNDWLPQTITKFGDYSVKDLFKPPHDADMLRSGGHLAQVPYTPPSAAAMYTGRPDMPHAQLGLVMGPINKGLMDTVQNSEQANKLKQAISLGMMEGGGRMTSTNMMFDTDRYPRAQDGTQMAMGGELQVLDGGRAETISKNPFLPHGGEMIMFKGRSHDNGGIPIQYGENGVEVEGNEPAVKLKDGGNNDNLVVFGNIKINKDIANLMEDKNAEGRKFKTYMADIGKNDAKQQKSIQKGLELIEQYNGNSVFDQLGMNSGMAKLMGGTAQQKINAEKIKNAALVQDSIHQTANELGVKSDKLAEGKLERQTDPSMAKSGKTLKKAQNGQSYLNGRLLNPKDPRDAALIKENLDDAAKADAEIKAHFAKKQQGITPINMSQFTAPQIGNIAQDEIPSEFGPITNSPFGGSSNYINKPTASGFNAPNFGGTSRPSIVPYNEAQYVSRQPLSYPDAPQAFSGNPADMTQADLSSPGFGSKAWNAIKAAGNFLGKEAKQYGPGILSQVSPFLRPTNQEGLDPEQLYPEYYSMATNQLEPVKAQKFQPRLDNPYSISMNDKLSAIDSQSRAIMRQVGNNPSVLANIAGQVLQAKNEVLGEENRINQATAMQVYDRNRAKLDDADKLNLQILDNQYVRQSEAKSKTKAQALEALKSIAAKTAQNKLENRQLATYENTYNYRFSPNGVAYNVNDPYQFNIPNIGTNSTNSLSEYERAKALTNSYESRFKKEGKSKNGSIVKALKTL